MSWLKRSSTMQGKPPKKPYSPDNWGFSYTCRVPRFSEDEIMFINLSSAYWGKQYYFKKSDDLWFSRYSGSALSFHDAVSEFTQKLSEDQHMVQHSDDNIL